MKKNNSPLRAHWFVPCSPSFRKNIFTFLFISALCFASLGAIGQVHIDPEARPCIKARTTPQMDLPTTVEGMANYQELVKSHLSSAQRAAIAAASNPAPANRMVNSANRSAGSNNIVNPGPNDIIVPGTLSLADPTYNRTLSMAQGGTCSLSAVGTAVHYKTHSFTLTTSSQVTLSFLSADGASITPATADTYVSLYGTAGFIPTAPCTNHIMSNDDFTGSLSKVSTTTALPAGTYTAVVTSFDNTPTDFPWTYNLAIIYNTGGGGCTSAERIADGGFEASTDNGTTVTNTNWTTTSTNFGSSLCDVSLCGTGSGAAPPRSGNFWTWFGGIAAAETGVVQQSVTIPTGSTATLNYYLRIGTVNAPFNATLKVIVDGVTKQTFTEPATAESAYTLRTLDMSAYADGNPHVLRFQYDNPSGSGTSNFTLDDISLINTCTATGPTVTINQAATQADPTSVSPIVFTATFSEAVTGFTNSDIVLSGTAGATTAVVSGAGPVYTVTVSGMTSSGTVIATIPAGAATSVATSTASAASTSTDNTVTYNAPTAPTVTINQAAAQADPTSTSPILFTAVFSEPVTGFATGDVTLSGTAGATTAIVSGTGPTYTITVSGMTSSGTVIATIASGVATSTATSLPNAASTSTDNTVTFNIPVPTVTINQAATQADPTSTSPILFTATFSEAVNGFATGDVTLSGTAGATTAIVSGTGPTYTVTVSGMTGSGTVIATIPAAVATSAATGVNNAASTSTDNTVTFNFVAGCTLTCPANITVSNTPGSCGANVTFAATTTSGGCGAVTTTPASGSFFPIGTTTVTSTSGSASCSFTVTVNDTEVPVITCPANVVVCGSQVVNYPLPTVTDNCTTAYALTQSTSTAITAGSPSCNAGGLHTDNSYYRVYDLSTAGNTKPYTLNKVTFGIEQATGAGGSQPVTVKVYTLSGAFTLANLTLVASQNVTVPNQSLSLMTVSLSAPPTVPANAKLVIELFTPNGQTAGNSFFIGSNTAAQTGISYIAAASCGITQPTDLASIGFGTRHIVLNGDGAFGYLVPVQTAGLPSGSTFPVGTTVNTYKATDAAGNSSSCSFNVIVNALPTVNAVANQSLCNGAATAAVNFSSPVSGATFSWTNNTPSIGLAATGTGNIASFTAVNTTSAPVTATISVTASATTNGVTCTGAPTTFTITVNPSANATATPSSQTICSGANITTIALTSTVAGTTYSWTRDNSSSTTVPGGIQASGTGNSISGFMVNTTTAPVTVTFTITPTASGCAGAPITATVIVNPLASATATPATSAVCSGSAITPIALTSNVAGATYNWTRDNTATVTGIAASGTGNSITGTPNSSSTSPVLVTFTITPSFGGCAGVPIVAFLTVNPVVTVTQPTNQTVCNGAATTAVNFASPVSGTTYSWTNNTPSIGLAASGTGNIASFNAANTTNAPVTATITVTPTANGCPGAAKTFTITVNPTATVNAVANQTLCAGTATTAITFGSPVAGATFSWTNNTPSIGLAATGTGNIASFTAVNTTSSAVTATITVTPTANGCPGTASTFTITVNALSTAPTAASSSITTSCGPTTTTLNVTGGSLGTGASWNWYTGSCGGTLIGTGATLTNVTVNSTTTYYVRAEGTCNTTACASVTVTINPQPTISISASPYISLLPTMTTTLTATASPSSPGDVYVWYKNGNVVTGATGNTLAVNVDALGSYTARVTTALSCTALSSALIIKDSATDKVFIYPNPNNGRFSVRYYSSAQNFGFLRMVTLFDSKGAIVHNKPYTITAPYSVMDINVKNLGKGIYTLVVSDYLGNRLTEGKVVVQ